MKKPVGIAALVKVGDWVLTGFSPAKSKTPFRVSRIREGTSSETGCTVDLEGLVDNIDANWIYKIVPPP